MPHEFDTQTQNKSPRMTDDEARAVVALWQSEQMDSPERARPTPADVAEGLDISTADAMRLLSQVRAQRAAAREAQQAAQQEELARAEAAAHLAELRARQAEAEAREARAEADARAQARYARQHTPPDEQDVQYDTVYRVMLRDNAYWQQKDNDSWKLPVIIVVVFVLWMLIVSLLHTSGGFMADPPGTTCYMNGGRVPCSQFPDAVRKHP